MAAASAGHRKSFSPRPVRVEPSQFHKTKPVFPREGAHGRKTQLYNPNDRPKTVTQDQTTKRIKRRNAALDPEDQPAESDSDSEDDLLIEDIIEEDTDPDLLIEDVIDEIVEDELLDDEEVPEDEDQVNVTISWEVQNGVYSPGGRIWNKYDFRYEEDPENPPHWIDSPVIVCKITNLGPVPVKANFTDKSGEAVAIHYAGQSPQIPAGETASFSFTLGNGIDVDVQKLLESDGGLNGAISVTLTAVPV